MSYRCEICRTQVAPKKPRLIWHVYRLNGDIEREVGVCVMCKTDLEHGKKLADLVEENREPEYVPEPEIAKAAPIVIVQSAARVTQKAEGGVATLEPKPKPAPSKYTRAVPIQFGRRS